VVAACDGVTRGIDFFGVESFDRLVLNGIHRAATRESLLRKPERHRTVRPEHTAEQQSFRLSIVSLTDVSKKQESVRL
jgi:hypothetical protein